ncbi:multi-sensor signal transduction histidine kinase [Candidatus Vecturithrix granuli]|uniref:histidine kinase n=1 Tax=Vecturithrix granuli TaxID=1499967 RepID=A0A0S6W5T0_VECG1|nr:multi-sensor signal transduction histidine kinase [Candidatus Vecturithrix granuli]
MKDEEKTHVQLCEEIKALRQRNAELENLVITYQERMEVGLREHEERFRQIIEDTEAGYFFIDRAGIFRQVNAAWLRLHGYSSADEILGKHFSITQVDTDFESAQRNVERSLAGAPIPSGEFTRRCKDGSIGYHTFTVRPVIKEGKVIGLEGFIIDTTERKRVADALRKRDHFIAQILDHAPFLVYIYDLEEQRNIYVNARSFSMLGYSPEEVTDFQANLFPTLIHPDDLPRVSAHGIHIQAAHDDEVLEIEYRIRHANGNWYVLHRWDTVFLRTRDGQVKQYAGTAIDITEVRRAEQALRESERKFRGLYTTMSEGVILHEILYDASGRAVDYCILDVNPKFEQLTGIPAEQALGKLASELYDTGVAPYLDVYAEVARTGKPTTFETYFSPMNKHFQISVFSPENGKFATIFTDISQRKRTELEVLRFNTELEQRVRQRTAQLDAANKELQSFVYAASHDLKAPLRGINSLASWIQTDYARIFDAKGREMLDLLVNRVKRMDRLIDGILYYSRIGRVYEPREKLDLNVLVQEVIDLLASPDHIHITVENTLPVIIAERTRILQVFQNLLSNAIKFLDKPQGTITIRCDEAGANWRFSVTDNGPGIDPKYHDKIFQIFQTLQPRDELESTGIGLSIVKKIVECYGGKIWVESELGNGSTFLFNFPKARNPTMNTMKA